MNNLPSMTDRPFGAPLTSAETGVPASERATPAFTPAGRLTGEFEFTVPGMPVPYARAAGGKTMHRFTPAKQRNAMGTVKLFCSVAMKGMAPLDGPIALTVNAIYPWPSSLSRRAREKPGADFKISRPDIDNLAKLVMDALNSVAWCDDARICVLHLEKYYGDIPCLRVRVRKLS